MTSIPGTDVGGNNGKSVKLMAKTIRIRAPALDNSDLIRRLKRTTLIGRIMNPDVQSVRSLVLMMPRLWKLEDRVVGSDLGSGTFRFDFEREEDILELMKTEPFNFNHWMVSIVWWEPIIHKNYPSAITLWVRIVGVPLRFSTDEIFRGIGKELGTVREVDEENAMVKVTIDSTMPLCLKISIRLKRVVKRRWCGWSMRSFSVTVVLVLVFVMIKNLAHKVTCTNLFWHGKKRRIWVNRTKMLHIWNSKSRDAWNYSRI